MQFFLRIVGVCYIYWLYIIQIILFTYRCNDVTSLKLQHDLIYSSSHPLFPFGVSIPCSSPNGSSSSSSTGFFITDCLALHTSVPRNKRGRAWGGAQTFHSTLVLAQWEAGPVV